MSLDVRQVILVGDAEEADELRAVLTDAGYAVAVCASLAEAQEKARTLETPALFLIDEPPHGSLVAFLAALQQHRARDVEAMPVVLLTRGNPRALTGIREVIAKPFVVALVLEVVQRLFEGL